MNLMDSPSLKVQCQSALALQNLASDGACPLLSSRTPTHIPFRKVSGQSVKADGLSALIRPTCTAEREREPERTALADSLVNPPSFMP